MVVLFHFEESNGEIHAHGAEKTGIDFEPVPCSFLLSELV